MAVPGGVTSIGSPRDVGETDFVDGSMGIFL